MLLDFQICQIWGDGLFFSRIKKQTFFCLKENFEINKNSQQFYQKNSKELLKNSNVICKVRGVKSLIL